MTQSHPSHPDTARRERLAESTLDLLAFDTQNPPGETAELLAWLEGIVLEWGVDTEWIETVDGKPNLVATIPGDTEWTLLYEGHVDTVPYEAATWEYDPLGQRVDDRLYGRGATDMKGAVAAMVETLREFAVAADERPPITLQFAFVSDEETGGEAGIDAVLEADAISADAAVVGETTATDDRYSVAVADKGRIWLTLEASGEAAHGSRPMCGENAVDRLYEVISDCRESITTGRLGYPETVDRIVEETIDYYAASDRSPLASEEAFAYPTVNLGRLEGGSTVNSVPGTATAEVDVRVTPGASTRAVFERIDACLGAKPDVSITDVSIQEGSYTDPAAPFVDWVVEVGQEVGDQRVFRRCATGGGDVKKLRAAGIHAVEAAVGSDTAHQADEYVPLDALEATAEWYRQLPWAVAP